MTIRARASDGAAGSAAEASVTPPRRRVRRVLLRTVPVALVVAATGTAGWLLGGDPVWAAFAAGLTLAAVLVLQSMWRPTVQTAGRDLNIVRSFTLKGGGFSALAATALILVVNGLMVRHVSTEVPGGRFYHPSGRSAALATGVTPTFLRDLPHTELRAESGSVPKSGARIKGRQCSRSVHLSVSSIGRGRLVTITPGRRFERFRALAGLPDDTDQGVSVEFALLGDKQQGIQSGRATPGAPVEFDRDVSAYTTLYLRTTLITSENGPVYAGDYRAVWGDAQFLPVNGQVGGCAAPG
ncbi:NPCBM/NEW2 domain-containing protein [Actinomadura kijaniata]|uniref:NPCBM/NEW2 domain-containing protein n=1 Tax=Actinomadura kijaniata TaxID=46161 RepID=UPI00082AE9E9|nr:NPCBM/NEW2 domain-containing protein [Actinomadura kijaniata]